ncbi:3-isopropylmalate dehydratase small subunit [Labrys monachus]|uniref:3-isopropylmalate dehydratase small subunit n=1 Tax=Labrys monachus TaxID=217067 RepID=A0ABU0FG94_9HYPH|nr:3-isopropylmalate dehydratase small subunit [Labrys monachus]MDQ0393622.1 3-isopropylmalate/(R)-2-methylmalate dehydratase small subunit [Labrys monachus]
MESFETFRAPALPFAGINVDTDQILPARFLSKPRSGGFGQYLFHDLRFDETGAERSGFVLNQPAFRNTRILVGEENFACGSSRENAVWAIADYGYRVVVASSFGDIFFSNSLKNGLLPVVLPAEATTALIAALSREPGATIEVDLEAQRLTGPDGVTHSFDIDPFSKHCLLKGIDELDYTLSQMDKVDEFERRRAESEG